MSDSMREWGANKDSAISEQNARRLQSRIKQILSDLSIAERMIEIRESLNRIEDFCIAPSSRVAFTKYRDQILKHVNELLDSPAEGRMTNEKDD